MSDKTQLSTEYKSQGHKPNKKILAVILAVSIVVVSAAVGLGYTIARYAESLDDDYHYVDAKDFFFSADYLKPFGQIGSYTIYNVSGSSRDIPINVYNYCDELSITDEDITFSASVKNGGTITTGDQTISGGEKNSKEIILTVKDPGTYTVTVASSKPYVQTLSATFTVVEYKAPEIEYNIVDSSDYVTLNIAIGPNQIKTCNVDFAWDSASYILDTTNELFSDVTVIAETGYSRVTGIEMNAGGSYQVILYKKNLNSAPPSKAGSAAATANQNAVYVGILNAG